MPSSSSRASFATTLAAAALSILDYEAYEEMALKQMEELAARALAEFKIRDVAIVHRLGRLEIGETSVLIVVASAHRAAAFDACRWLIDTLKRTVPIWKKEHFEDGAVWADGEPFPDEIPSRSRHPFRGGVHLSDQPVWLHSPRFLSAICIPLARDGLSVAEIPFSGARRTQAKCPNFPDETSGNCRSSAGSVPCLRCPGVRYHFQS